MTFNMGKRGEKKRYQGSLVHAYIDPHSRLDTRSASAFGASTADRICAIQERYFELLQSRTREVRGSTASIPDFQKGAARRSARLDGS